MPYTTTTRTDFRCFWALIVTNWVSFCRRFADSNWNYPLFYLYSKFDFVWTLLILSCIGLLLFLLNRYSPPLFKQWMWQMACLKQFGPKVLLSVLWSGALPNGEYRALNPTNGNLIRGALNCCFGDWGRVVWCEIHYVGSEYPREIVITRQVLISVCRSAHWYSQLWAREASWSACFLTASSKGVSYSCSPPTN